MTSKNVIVNGKSFSLSERIGKGGEGEIFTLIEDKSLALKVYTTSDKNIREPKIDLMVKLDLAGKSSLVSFPIAVARSLKGDFIGFVMKLVEGNKPLHELYSPGPRKLHFAQADYRFLVRAAANIARAVASVHKAGCVIGDINHSGILISSKAVAALIDADSFQVSSGDKKFFCRVGVPEYTPPELQGKNLSSIERTVNHDAFGLAIIIFQILFMGRHPYVGTVRSGDIPPIHENIKNLRYVYAGSINVGMDQPPGTPSVVDFSQTISDYFEQAFLNAGNKLRPSAESWIKALEALEASLVGCGDNPLHFIPKDASECPWCEMESLLGTILFLPPYQTFDSIQTHGDLGAANFNLDEIWRKIESLHLSINISPNLKVANVKPSPAAEKEKAKPTKFNSILFGIAGIGAFFIFPYAFILWIPLIFWSFSKSEESTRINPKQFNEAYLNADKRWGIELESWKKRTGVQNYLVLKRELEEAKEAYKKAGYVEQGLIQKYKNERREKQLYAFLDSFYISRANIKGIGPAKATQLASYGIDTAADLISSKILQVPGFGATNSKPLFEWRKLLERRFVYQPNETERDRQEFAKIRLASQNQLASLRQKLLIGERSLRDMVSKVRSNALIEDPLLNMVNTQILQAKLDLEYLGLKLPAQQTIASTYTSSTSTSATTKYQQNGTATATKVSCPRCGSAMVKRLARRGRNAGNYFWGCSRYPSCKGTRNI